MSIFLGPSRLSTWILLNLPTMYSNWASYTNGLLDKRMVSAWAISLQHAELPKRSLRSNPNSNYKLGVIPLSHIAWSQSHQTSILLIQLQKHCQATLSQLPITRAEMELFDMTESSTETEKVSKTFLTRLPLTWRSPEFSTLARQLDKIHIHKTIVTKGR